MAEKKNSAASVRQRVLNLARERGEDFGIVLTKYGLERILARLAKSPYQNQFVLKGAMLFAVWTDLPHRSTRDLDFLSFGEYGITEIENVFRELIEIEIEDGLVFDAESVRGAKIKEDQEYEGVRVHLTADLAGARIPLRIDVGFGDAVTPGAAEIEFPTLLGFPAPTIRTYRRETVVAEKFQAMVSLGIGNSRMKDFYDVWYLARNFEFDGGQLQAAIGATFERRKTSLPSDSLPPLALTEEFAADSDKQKQWRAFLRRAQIHPAIDLDTVTATLKKFLLPPTRALASETAFPQRWMPEESDWKPEAKN